MPDHPVKTDPSTSADEKPVGSAPSPASRQASVSRTFLFSFGALMVLLWGAMALAAGGGTLGGASYQDACPEEATAAVAAAESTGVVAKPLGNLYAIGTEHATTEQYVRTRGCSLRYAVLPVKTSTQTAALAALASGGWDATVSPSVTEATGQPIRATKTVAGTNWVVLVPADGSSLSLSIQP